MAIKIINGKKKYINTSISLTRFFYITYNGNYYSKKHNEFNARVYMAEFFQDEKTAKIELRKIILNLKNDISEGERLLERLSQKENTKEIKERRIKLQKSLSELQMQLDVFENSKVVEIEKEFIENEYKLIMQHSVISGAVFYNHLRHFKSNIEHLSKVKSNEKEAIIKLLRILTPIDAEQQRFLNVAEDLTDDYLGNYDLFIRNISSVLCHEVDFFNDLCEMIQDKKGFSNLKRSLTNFKKNKV